MRVLTSFLALLLAAAPVAATPAIVAPDDVAQPREPDRRGADPITPIPRPTFALSGHVTGGGKPVAGAKITIRALVMRRCKSSDPDCGNPQLPITKPIELVTDADGAFAVPDLPRGFYAIEVRAPGWRKRTRTVTMTEARAVDVGLRRATRRHVAAPAAPRSPSANPPDGFPGE